MIRPQSNNPTRSSRNSTASIEQPNPKSRRSSFVQSLIAEYKNSSHKKSQKTPNPSHCNPTLNHSNAGSNKINFKSSHSNNQQDTLRQRENIPDPGKEHLIKRPVLKMDLSQNQVQQVHFPLKEMNFMEKYRSTQLTRQPQAINTMPRKGSNAKKKHSNPINFNLESNYESQFLKTMFLAKGKTENDTMREMKTYEKRKTVIGRNFDIDAIFSQSQRDRDNLLVREMQKTQESFLRQCKEVVQSIISGKYQQGLNDLLKMKKKLKEMASKDQNADIKRTQKQSFSSIIQKRQCTNLFLYGMIIIQLKGTNGEKQICSIVQKLQKKLRSYLMNGQRQTKEELQASVFILEMNRLVSSLKEFVLKPESLSIDTMKGLLDQCKQIKLSAEMSLIKEMINFISVLFDEISQNKNKNQIVSQKMLEYAKNQLKRLSRQQNEGNFSNKIHNILIERVIFMAVYSIWKQYLSQSKSLLQTTSKYQYPQHFIWDPEVCFPTFDTEKDLDSFVKSTLTKKYQLLIQKIIIFISLTQMNPKENELIRLKTEINDLKDFINEKDLSDNSQKSSNGTNLQQLEFIITFPLLFLYYHSLVVQSAFDNGLSETMEYIPTKCFYDQLQILQTSKKFLSSYISQSCPQLQNLQTLPFTQLQSLNSWINLQLVQLYFRIGELSTAAQLVSQNSTFLLYHLTSPSYGTNLQFSWSNFLDKYALRHELNIVLIFWKTLHFNSQLNLIAENQSLSLSEQIFLHLLHLKLNTYSINDQRSHQQLISMFGHLFGKQLNLEDFSNEKSLKIGTEVKRLLQIQISLQIIKKKTGKHYSDQQNRPSDTFANEQIDEDFQEDFGPQHQQDYNSYKDLSGCKINPSLSKKSSRYSQMTKFMGHENFEEQKDTQYLEQFLEKVQKPCQYHTNYLKSEFAKIRTLKSEKISETAQTLSEFLQMKQQFQILTGLQ